MHPHACRKNVLLTGRPGIGKSTLILKVLERLRAPHRGFYTRELRGIASRLGFEAVTLGGEHVVLAHVDQAGPPRVGKYGVAVARFEAVIVPSIDAADWPPDGVIVIDEIGRMECRSHLFRETALQALASPAPVLGTVGLQNDPFLRAVRRRDDVHLIVVRADNRDRLVTEVVRTLEQLTGAGSPPPSEGVLHEP
jgi:nucleoside-triphosphatase THEP1